MTETLDQTAQRIAEKGREALLSRLRPAFAEAAATHADVLELDDEKLERMVQSAADRADGLQWRRALATVATEELGIGLGEALGHPAVARAQELLGAPSYEESLAAISQAGATAPAADEPEREAGSAEDEARDAEDEAGSAETEARDAEAPETEARDAEAPETDARDAEAPDEAGTEAGTDDDGLPIRFPVLHLDGLYGFDEEEELELRFSEQGLDVLRPQDDESVAHFAWSELHGIEVLTGRGRMLRRRAAQTRVILTATGRHARFQAPGTDAQALKERLEPVLAKLGGDG